jgi:hypothetical protein
MIEQEWLECRSPERMLEFLQGRANNRTLRLFAVACCRRVWPVVTDLQCRAAVEAAERFVDGLLSREKFEEVLQPVVSLWAELPDAEEGNWEPTHYMIAAARHLNDAGAARHAARFAARGLACQAGRDGGPEFLAAGEAEEAVQCDLIRDLFGNPFRPFHLDPDWRIGPGRVAVQRAREIAREGKFESLPSLADELEQAGCGNRAVLEHCRGSGPHASGCWVVEALLGHDSAVRTDPLPETEWQACSEPMGLLVALRGTDSDRKWRLFAVACCRRIAHLMTDERSRRAVEVAARFADGAATEAELEAARSAAQQALDDAEEVVRQRRARPNVHNEPAIAVALCRLLAASAARSALSRDPRVSDAAPGSDAPRSGHPTPGFAAQAVYNHAYADFCSKHSDAFALFFSNHSDTSWEKAEFAANSVVTAESRCQCKLLYEVFGEYLGPPGMEGGSSPSSLFPLEQWDLLLRPRNLTLRLEWLTWNGGTVPRLAQAIYDEEAFDRLPVLADALEDAGCSEPAILSHLRGPGPHVRGCWVVDLLLGRA